MPAVDTRTLYALASDPECLFGGDLEKSLSQHLIDTRAEGFASAADGMAERCEEVRDWAAAARIRCRAVVLGADPEARRSAEVRALTETAPLAIQRGAWLSGLIVMAGVEDQRRLDILTTYAADVGVGHPRRSHGSAYLRTLGAFGLAQHAEPAANLQADTRISDASFDLPAVLLAMGRLPHRFEAEILGADLCLRAAWPFPALAVLDGPPAPDERPLPVVDPTGSSDSYRHRFGVGFDWAFRQLARWTSLMEDELAGSLDPAYDMAALLRSRAYEAAMYHDHVTIGNTSLRALFESAAEDPAALLRALAASPLITPGYATASALTTSLIGDTGPMFRVFSEPELVVIRRWIDALPPGGGRAVDVPVDVPADVPAVVPRALAESLRLDVADASPWQTSPMPDLELRDAYVRLLDNSDTPGLRRWADEYIIGWLEGVTDPPEGGLPVEYRPARLGTWLDEQLGRHEADYEEARDLALPGRDELVDTTVQLAPLALIDGAWIRGFTDYSLADSPVGYTLFETLWDELGNGDLGLNHPRIFRELLEAMGVDMAETHTRAFAHWTGLRTEAFQLPVFWLSLSRFPVSRAAETVGVNLAMELSGVGGSYRRSSIALRHHGFPTRFVDIHNTIDNVSTGHAAWAMRSVQTFMSTVAETDREITWDRVRRGYAALGGSGAVTLDIVRAQP